MALTGIPGMAQASDVEVTVGDVTFAIVDETSIPSSLTGQAGDAEAGKAAFVDRRKGNCLSCHLVSALSDLPFHGEVGPPLDGVAGRMDAGEMRLRIVDPKIMNEATIMPGFFRDAGLNHVLEDFQGKTILSAQEVEDIVAYLETFAE